MSNMCEEEAELANWDPRHDDYHNPKSLIIGGDGPAANFVRTNNLARTKEVVKERPGLYVRNVPRSMTNDGMLRLFSEHGKVLSAFVGNSSKGSTQHKNNWAIVKVESIKDAMHIMSALNGAPPLNLKLELAMTSEERERRKQQRTEEEQHNQEMEKLVDNFNTSSMVQPNKSGIGRGRITSFGRSSCPDDGSPRRPGSLYNTPGTSSARKSIGEMLQVMAKPLGTSIIAKEVSDVLKEESESVEPSNGKQGVDLTKSATAASANQKVVVEMSLGSVAVGYRKPRPCILCREGGKYRCSVCKAWYCSKICQVDDWYDHKDHCQPPPSLEKADSSIYNIDEDGSNDEPLDTHQLTNNSSPNLRSQNPSSKNSASTSKLQSDMNDTNNDIQQENYIASIHAQCQVTTTTIMNEVTSTTIMNDEESSEEIKKLEIVSSTPIKETQSSSFDLKKNNQIANAINKINLSNFNLGPIEKKQPIQDHDINEINPGIKETINSRDEPDFVKVSSKMNPKNEIVASVNSVYSALSTKSKSDSVNDIKTIASVNSGGSASSAKIKSNSINGIAPEKQSLLKEPKVFEHADKEIKTTPNKDFKYEKSDIITKGSSPFLFPSLCDEMDIEKTYKGLIFTKVDNYSHFTMTILNSTTNSTADTILSQGSGLIAEAPHVSNFEVTFGVLVGAMFEDDQVWYRAYVIDKLDDGSIKVFFIDFGNTEIVKKVKPLPDGILSQAAGLIVIAKRHSSYSDPGKLKAIIKLDNTIDFKLVGKKGTSMKVSLLDKNGDLIGTFILRPWYTSLEISPALSRAPSKNSVSVEISPNESFSSSIKSPAPTSVLKEENKLESKTTTHGIVNGGIDESRTNLGIQQKDKSPLAEISTIGKQSTGARPKEKATSSPLQEFNPYRGVTQKAKSVEMKSIDSLLQNISKDQISICKRLSKDPVTASDISKGEAQFWASSLNCEKLEVGKSYDVLPVWMSAEDNCIWVQVFTKENVTSFQKMQEDMNKYCEKGAPTVANLSPGEVVCGQDADIWYRSEVREVLEDQINVFFLDFGNSSTLAPDHIRKINPNLMNLQKMAVKITLKDININKVEVQQKLLKCIGSEEYIKMRIESVNPEVASILDDKMGLYKDLQEDTKNSQVREIGLDDESCLNESCPSEDLQNIPGPSEPPTFRKITKVEPPKAPSSSSQSSPLTPVSPSSNAVEKPSGYQGCSMSEAFGRMKGVIQYESCPSEKLDVGKENIVIVMTNDNPLSIMVIPADPEKYEYLNTVLQEEIRIHCESLPNQHYQPVSSEMCLAKFDEDGVWYRAACLTSDLNNFYVIFVDYGNMSLVSHENIRPMDPKFLETPLMALHCQMTGIDISRPEAVLKAEVVEAFQGLLPVNSVATVRVREMTEGGIYFIDIPHVLGALKEQRLID